ncbi:hypothetical protein FFLO_00783 [Filobasidium floriforme]|uniref:GTP-binding protein n=1 Tax=Filobasidium floriforme TaxID=5210 RepID=A0A8K0NT96_9TREE|nr:Gtr1/RagA G protein conserved region-domain-containing protein [Filobasidium floriforme]KAG7571271.1 hypothetical protein FFLO_00783 [Filobasidium floriforme]KAH8085851.1 Gtr1/RagA G protein conserved region-domain-containing protein [Filobasidium floriforme]
MPQDNKKKKVLLMGKSGSGKTSMRSVIFSNMIAKDTSRLGATMDVEHSHVVFMGGLKLNLWDCGGQENFLAHFISTQKSEIFKNVAVLIYRTETEWERDVKYFEECIEALYSLAQEEQTETDPSAPVVPPKVWVLVNKMDIVGDGVASKKIKVFEEKRDEIERRCGAVGKRFGMDVGRGRGVRCFGTSIWDESLYKAWSSVIHNLIPNAALINSHLTHLRNISSCLEAVLFERQTFLVLAKSGSGLDADPDLDPGASTGTNKTLGNTGAAEDEEKNKVKAKAVMMDVEGLDEVEVANGARGLERKRFEKISEVVKGFRRTCQRNSQPFINLEARFDNASIGLDVLTSNTYLMLVSSEPWVEPSLLMFNIEQARQHFEELTGEQVENPCLICKSHPESKYRVEDSIAEKREEWGHG